jgi:hypothetical protein
LLVSYRPYLRLASHSLHGDHLKSSHRGASCALSRLRRTSSASIAVIRHLEYGGGTLARTPEFCVMCHSNWPGMRLVSRACRYVASGPGRAAGNTDKTSKLRQERWVAAAAASEAALERDIQRASPRVAGPAGLGCDLVFQCTPLLTMKAVLGRDPGASTLVAAYGACRSTRRPVQGAFGRAATHYCHADVIVTCSSFSSIQGGPVQQYELYSHGRTRATQASLALMTLLGRSALIRLPAGAQTLPHAARDPSANRRAPAPALGARGRGKAKATQRQQSA